MGGDIEIHIPSVPGIYLAPFRRKICLCLFDTRASLIAHLVKNLPAMWETWVRAMVWEDSPGEGKGYPLQYSGLENSMDCILYGVTKSWTQLSDFHFHFDTHHLKVVGMGQAIRSSFT